MAWWIFGNNSGPRNSMLDMAGNLPQSMAQLRGRAAIGVYYSSAPDGWLRDNAPVSGDWVNVPAALLGSPRTKNQLNLDQIGPFDAEIQQATALQAALAQSLLELR